jgi:hypothetical protein
MIRDNFGCDGIGATKIDCHVCYARKSRSCEWCGGSGEIFLERCPTACLTPDVIQMHRGYSWYRKGFLPAGGAMMEQSAAFASGVRILESCYAMHEELSRSKRK